MPAVLPESQAGVLEDGVEALLPKAEVNDGEEFADLEEEQAPAEPTKKKPAKKEAKPVANADDELPEELKGKTPAQLAKMYKEAQSLIGRQGSELGDYRRKADMLIQANLENMAAKRRADEEAAAKAAPKKPAVDDETEFFAQPKAAIEKAIANHPLIKEIRETLGKAAQEQAIGRATSATERFQATHPDAPQIMADPEFRQWVQASKVRQQLLQQAHTRFDFDAGDEVFGTWKALKGIKSAADQEAADATAAAQALAKRKQALKDAAAPSGGNPAPKETGSKKIYRRADVLKLMEEDPARYEALAPEIEKAYRENRVR